MNQFPHSDQETEPKTILVIDDIPSLRSIYQAYLADAGYRPIAAKSAAEGLEQFHRSGAQVVLLDMFLPDRDGLDLMREMLDLRPATAVVVVTADLSIDRAVMAMRYGARDFLVKPISEDRLLTAIENACLAVQRAEAAANPIAPDPGPGFIGTSHAVRSLVAALDAAAERGAPALVHGEEGTGKELAARTIHMQRQGADARDFLKVDFGLLPPDRIEDHLYGTAQRQGMIRAAIGGTLFLHRISDLTPAQQPRLLEALRETPELRVVASATASPQALRDQGLLDPELHRWLTAEAIRVPPLRERREDILPLAQAFLKRFAARERRNLQRIAGRTETLLIEHSWPGNVRQLMSIIQAITVLHDGDAVTPAMLPEEMRGPEPAGSPTPEALAGLTLTEIERIVIEAAVSRHEGSVPRAAEELDVAASTIYRKIGLWRRD
jgi:DNA-binding NtrC family response regulator